MPVCAVLVPYTVQQSNAPGQTVSVTLVQVDQTRTDYSACDFVVESGPDYSNVQTKLAGAGTSTSAGTTQVYPAWNELGSLTLADAQAIGPYIWLLWAGAWGYKQIMRMITNEGDKNEI